MSVNTGHGLPFLPGCTFQDLTKSAFHRPQTLTYRNGYALPHRPIVGIGQDPLLSAKMIQDEINELSSELLAPAYGPSNHSNSSTFIPAHVALDKKVLRFYAYFKQDVFYSANEAFCVHPVVIYYYLEDDNMSITEPLVENSGITQTKLVKRQRLPKNDSGAHYHWKDLNVGMDLMVYGILYRITHCDDYTKQFMESEGIVVNDPEPTPVDPYISSRTQPKRSHVTSSEFDQLHKFLTLDGQVLRFFAVLDDSDSMYEETRPMNINFYLVDDTVEIREIHRPNSGRDPFPVFMHRQKLPKIFNSTCETFPQCVLEVSPKEVQEFYSPKDFQVGETVELMGRRFLLYDCDDFTKRYFQKNHPDIEIKSMEAPKKVGAFQVGRKEFPPYNGFGSLEDSLQNCLHLNPKPPKKDLKNLWENDHIVLRYIAKLDSRFPEDESRRFILSYFLSDNMISIFEKPRRNTGITGGHFLKKIRVPKPGSTVNNPEFYLPADFAIGATVEIFCHRFVLIDADRYVLTYLESIADQIPSETLISLRQKLGVDSGHEVANNQMVKDNEVTEVVFAE